MALMGWGALRPKAGGMYCSRIRAFKGIVRKKENPHVRVMCVLLLVCTTHNVLSYYSSININVRQMRHLSCFGKVRLRSMSCALLRMHRRDKCEPAPVPATSLPSPFSS